MLFDDYPIAQEIKNNLSKMGYRRPTDIQFKSIPAILDKEDVLAIAQTGTGKTAAFAIPLINIINDKKRKNRFGGIRAVVMAPTRELAMQITQEFERIAKGTRVDVYCLTGGVDQDPQIKKLQEGIDILVVTPGRMFDLISQGYVNLDRVEYLVLDEADHMLDLGFIKDIEDVIRFIPKSRQTLFFSATINQKIKKLAYSVVKNAIRIHVSPKNPVAKNIKHSVAMIDMDDKRFYLEQLIKEYSEEKILVFVRTKVRAERVKAALKRVDLESVTIHSGKSQTQRNDAMQAFKTSRIKVLIATDISARGIDIPNVHYVVNYDMPDVPENYVHRVGRTGRGKNKGDAISFCSENEEVLLYDIETFLGHEINTFEISDDLTKDMRLISKDLSHDLKGLLSEINTIEDYKRKKKKGK